MGRLCGKIKLQLPDWLFSIGRRRCIRILVVQRTLSHSWNSCWAHKLLKSSFWSNLSILCLLCCSISINFVACLRVWNIWKGKDIASIAGRMLLCSAYFAISQFPAHTDHELQYFTILEHVLSLEIGLPEKGHKAKSDIDRPDFYICQVQLR